MSAVTTVEAARPAPLAPKPVPAPRPQPIAAGPNSLEALKAFGPLGYGLAVLLLEAAKEDALTQAYDLFPGKQPFPPEEGEKYLCDHRRQLVVYGSTEIISIAAAGAVEMLTELADRLGGSLPRVDLSKVPLAVRKDAADYALLMSGTVRWTEDSPAAELRPGEVYLPLWGEDGRFLICPWAAAEVAILEELAAEHQARAKLAAQRGAEAEAARAKAEERAKLQADLDQAAATGEAARQAGRERHAAELARQQGDRPGPRNPRQDIPRDRGQGRYNKSRRSARK